ncbi:hypothetical protein ACIRRA_43640 [Nocardia sp. NPDC101769]|uniref:hypothetical protein n=1 Tax=Nocardia sp. NPDC101769 TaxID=3364333 RepID=UPI003819FD9D
MLQPPATPQEISQLETDLGFALHPHLRALLERANGAVHTRYRDYGEHPAAFMPHRYELESTRKIAESCRNLVAITETDAAS